MSRLAFGQPNSIGLTMIVILRLSGYALIQYDLRLGFYSLTVLFLLVAVSYRFKKRS